MGNGLGDLDYADNEATGDEHAKMQSSSISNHGLNYFNHGRSVQAEAATSAIYKNTGEVADMVLRNVENALMTWATVVMWK